MEISVLNCEIFCSFFCKHLSHPCLVESIYKDVLPFFGPAFWTTFQYFDLWVPRHQGIGGTCRNFYVLSLQVKPFKGSFKGKVVFTFSLQSEGWDSIASNGRIQIEMFVHFFFLANSTCRAWFPFFTKDAHPPCTFEPTNEKEGWLKRVLYLRATNLISKNKKLITKGFALWPQSRASTSQGERDRLKQILGLHFWVIRLHIRGGVTIT